MVDENIIEETVDVFVNLPPINKKERSEKSEVKETVKTEEKGFFKKLWDKSIFPDMLEERKQKKAIVREARKEAIQELKPLLKEQIKQQELDKFSGKKKKDFMEKLAKGFEGIGQNMDVEKMMGTGGKSKNKDIGGMMGMGQSNDMFSDNKMNRLLGGRQPQQPQQPQQQPQNNNMFSDDKMNRLLGGRQPQQPQQPQKQQKQQKQETPEEKIKRMLG